MGSVRSCHKLPPWPTQTVSASPWPNPPLAKAEPICSGGKASVIRDVRRVIALLEWVSWKDLQLCREPKLEESAPEALHPVLQLFMKNHSP